MKRNNDFMQSVQGQKELYRQMDLDYMLIQSLPEGGFERKTILEGMIKSRRLEMARTVPNNSTNDEDEYETAFFELYRVAFSFV